LDNYYGLDETHPPVMKKLAVYNHGKNSTPWGEKTLVLAEAAKRRSYAVASPDCRQQPDPDARVAQLFWTFCRKHRIRSTMLNSDHRLLDALLVSVEKFERLLSKLSCLRKERGGLTVVSNFPFNQPEIIP
jgi:hypothetical protein